MSIKEDIEVCENKLLDIMKNRNLEVLDELLHEDLLFNAANGQTITKALIWKHIEPEIGLSMRPNPMIRK